MSSKPEENPFMPNVEVADETISVTSLSSTLRSSVHPICCFIYMLLKIVSIILYIFGYYIVGSATNQFIYLVIVLGADFYNVKNFSGRYLVGLRWWTSEDEKTKESVLSFEVTTKPETISKSDSRIFWTFLYISPVIWVFFALIALIRLNTIWLLASIIGCCFEFYNLYAYIKAAQESKSVMTSFSFLPKSLTKRAVETLGSVALGVARSSFAN